MGIKILLSRQQIQRLSNIFDNAGQVVLGVSVLSPILNGFDTPKILLLSLGCAGTFGCWFLSVYLAKKESDI